jgi:hypothetical protein
VLEDQDPDHVRAAEIAETFGQERSTAAVRVSLADKIHKARCTVNDLEAEGSGVWDRFNTGYEDQLWWYGSLAEVYAGHARQGRADPARAKDSRGSSTEWPTSIRRGIPKQP